MEKFKLDLVNDLVKEAIEALCKRKRWQDTFRHIIKAKRFNPNRAIDNRAACVSFDFLMELLAVKAAKPNLYFPLYLNGRFLYSTY